MTNSELRKSFILARKHSNIDLILMPLLKSNLYLVTKGLDSAGQPIFFTQQTPNLHGYCVTAAESKDVLQSIQDVVLLEINGKDLLRIIDPTLGILLAYKDGGDYLSPEQLDWFRSSLRN